MTMLKTFYVYTNINDLAIYLSHDAVMPAYLLNKDTFFGSFCSRNKYGIIITNKVFPREYIEKTCAHKNINPVVVEVALPGTTPARIVSDNYFVRQDNLSRFGENDLAAFVQGYLPGAEIVKVYGVTRKPETIDYGNAALVPGLIHPERFPSFPVGAKGFNYNLVEEILASVIEQPLLEKAVLRNKIKAAFTAALACFKENNDIFEGNFDQAIFELAEKVMTFEEFTSSPTKGMVKTSDNYIFPNIEKLLRGALVSDYGFVKQYPENIAMNMLLYQMAITVSLAERRVVDGVPQLFNTGAWKERLGLRFFRAVKRIAAGEAITERYRKILSLLGKEESAGAILAEAQDLDCYSAFRAIYLFTLSARFRNPHDVSATLLHFKVKPAEARLVWFLYGLNFGMNGLSVNFKNNYHAVYFGELLSIKHVKDKSLPREVVNTKEYFRVRGIPFPNSSEGYYLYHRSKKQERERESSFAQISLFSGGDKE